MEGIVPQFRVDFSEMLDDDIAFLISSDDYTIHSFSMKVFL
jgi:hypothetical protein